MRLRESTYVPLGYSVEYVTREKFRGFPGPLATICHARKGGAEFFAFGDRDGMYPKILKFQHLVPHMALFVEPVSGCILMEAAPGKLIWDWEKVDDIPSVERQLLEFVTGAKANGISHRDLRPWNVFLDDCSQITVIDWGNSEFATNDLDLKQANEFVRLLNGEITVHEACGVPVTWSPPWCKRP